MSLRSRARFFCFFGLMILVLTCGYAAAQSSERCGPYGNLPAPTLASAKPVCGKGEILGPWNDSEGTERYACFYTPASIKAGGKLPLLVFLHPSLFGTWTISHTNLLDLQAAAPLGATTAPGFMILAPQGRNTPHHYPWPDNSGLGWDNWYRQLSPGGEIKLGNRIYPENVDAAAIDHFIAQAARTGQVDTRRVYVTGWSNGAAMALLYALNRPSVAAVAAYSGPDPFGALSDPCPQKPVAGAPANNGEVHIFNPRVPVMNVHNACDIAGICPNAEKLAQELRAAGVAVDDVIIDSNGKRVDRCVDYCGTDPNGGLSLLGSPISWFTGLHRHERWPDAWTHAMLQFMRANPLRPAAAPF